MGASTDPVADAFEATEKRLNEWGRVCKTTSDHLGLPRISGIHAMIEHVRREDRLRKGVRRRSVRDVRKAWRRKQEIDAKETAEAFGFTEPSPNAVGRQKRPGRKSMPMINSKVLEVDGVVAKLPQWMQATILRSYLFGQPDRNASSDLRIPKDVYRLRRIAAVQFVEARLSEIGPSKEKIR